MDIFTRDVELMLAMGANTIRLYTLKRSRRHTLFLDLAYDKELVVVGGSSHPSYRRSRSSHRSYAKEGEVMD